MQKIRAEVAAAEKERRTKSAEALAAAERKLLQPSLFSTPAEEAEFLILAKDGVLVLESKTKAMVLPTVDDVNSIPSPSPGMMVFVNKTGAKRLAVFNGTVWSFWKPVN